MGSALSPIALSQASTLALRPSSDKVIGQQYSFVLGDISQAATPSLPFELNRYQAKFEVVRARSVLLGSDEYFLKLSGKKSGRPDLYIYLGNTSAQDAVNNLSEMLNPSYSLIGRSLPRIPTELLRSYAVGQESSYSNPLTLGRGSTYGTPTGWVDTLDVGNGGASIANWSNEQKLNYLWQKLGQELGTQGAHMLEELKKWWPALVLLAGATLIPGYGQWLALMLTAAYGAQAAANLVQAVFFAFAGKTTGDLDMSAKAAAAVLLDVAGLLVGGAAHKAIKYGARALPRVTKFLGNNDIFRLLSGRLQIQTKTFDALRFNLSQYLYGVIKNSQNGFPKHFTEAQRQNFVLQVAEEMMVAVVGRKRGILSDSEIRALGAQAANNPGQWIQNAIDRVVARSGSAGVQGRITGGSEGNSKTPRLTPGRVPMPPVNLDTRHAEILRRALANDELFGRLLSAIETINARLRGAGGTRDAAAVKKAIEGVLKGGGPQVFDDLLIGERNGKLVVAVKDSAGNWVGAAVTPNKLNGSVLGLDMEGLTRPVVRKKPEGTGGNRGKPPVNSEITEPTTRGGNNSRTQELPVIERPPSPNKRALVEGAKVQTAKGETLNALVITIDAYFEAAKTDKTFLAELRAVSKGQSYVARDGKVYTGMEEAVGNNTVTFRPAVNSNGTPKPGSIDVTVTGPGGKFVYTVDMADPWKPTGVKPIGANRPPNESGNTNGSGNTNTNRPPVSQTRPMRGQQVDPQTGATMISDQAALAGKLSVERIEQVKFANAGMVRNGTFKAKLGQMNAGEVATFGKKGQVVVKVQKVDDANTVRISVLGTDGKWYYSDFTRRTGGKESEGVADLSRTPFAGKPTTARGVNRNANESGNTTPSTTGPLNLEQAQTILRAKITRNASTSGDPEKLKAQLYKVADWIAQRAALDGAKNLKDEVALLKYYKNLSGSAVYALVMRLAADNQKLPPFDISNAQADAILNPRGVTQNTRPAVVREGTDTTLPTAAQLQVISRDAQAEFSRALTKKDQTDIEKGLSRFSRIFEEQRINDYRSGRSAGDRDKALDGLKGATRDRVQRAIDLIDRMRVGSGRGGAAAVEYDANKVAQAVNSFAAKYGNDLGIGLGFTRELQGALERAIAKLEANDPAAQAMREALAVLKAYERAAIERNAQIDGAVNAASKTGLGNLDIAQLKRLRDGIVGQLSRDDLSADQRKVYDSTLKKVNGVLTNLPGQSEPSNVPRANQSVDSTEVYFGEAFDKRYRSSLASKLQRLFGNESISITTNGNSNPQADGAIYPQIPTMTVGQVKALFSFGLKNTIIEVSLVPPTTITRTETYVVKVKSVPINSGGKTVHTFTAEFTCEVNPQGSIAKLGQVGLRSDSSGVGLPASINLMQQLRSIGIFQISIVAERSRQTGSNSVGYRVWPLIGFDGNLRNQDVWGLAEFLHENPAISRKLGVRAEEINESTKVSEILFSKIDGKLVPEMAEWWKKNGRTFVAEFNWKDPKSVSRLEKFSNQFGIPFAR
jgi:hypothetical protein